MDEKELKSKREIIIKALSNPNLDDAKKKIFENTLSKIDSQLEELKEQKPKEQKPKEQKPKEQKPKEQKPKEQKLYTKEECEDIIKEVKEKKARAKIQREKSERKTPTKKAVEKTESTIEVFIRKIREGKVTKDGIKKVIKELKEAIVILTKELNKL